MKLRTLVFWPHLVAGVLAGLVILMMCVTGVLLTYERQLVAWSDREFRSAPSGATRLGPEGLLAAWTQAHPELTPTAVTFAAAADAPVAVNVGQRTLFADAYTGNMLGESSPGVRRFMASLRAWHRWFAVTGEGRPVARAITGWSNLLFAFIVASGIYLWLPRTWGWPQVKAVMLFRGGLRGKARDFNWHNVIGIWSAVPLFIVVVSAVPISFTWANALVYRAVGEEVPAGREGGAGGRAADRRQARGDRATAGNAAPRPRSGDRRGNAERGEPNGASERPAPSFTGLDALYQQAEARVTGWRTINLRIPASPNAPVAFAIDRGDGGQPQLRSTLTFARNTGELVGQEGFADLSTGRRVRTVMRFAHTGEVLGITGQTVAGLVSAGGAVLVWTGLALSLRRFRAWRKRRSNPAATAASTQSNAA